MPFILANAWLASALIEFPKFRLPYMANVGQLPSTQGRMTHLSWDESGPCVLENGTFLAGADRDMPPPSEVDGEYPK
jgi:hypothetical protein